MKRFKRHKDYGFFDQDIRLNKLSQLGDPLEKLNTGVDFELFRGILEDNLTKLAKGKGGRPPYDYVLMFKILILQRYYNLSDDQVEYQINDRMSFMRFLDLTIADDVPDSKTVWNFKEQLVDLELTEPLFDLFLKELERLELVVNEGKIVDASFVEVPRQRNSRDENEQIKSGEIPESFKENNHKLAQKDTDARWTKKNNVSYYGYKNHIKIDTKSKIITKYIVTNASVHDSQPTESLLDITKDQGQDFHADSAYTGPEQEKVIADAGMNNKVCEKGYRNHPLTEEERTSNTEKSRIRSRVEHIFGFMENSMNGMYVYNIGIKRIQAVVGLMNLTYNMFRKVQLMG
ncbi:MAG: IS5 family transposase [Chitinophagales bacterium]|nr:IS5 family transposase [Chitinophagales bacterium]MCZ2101960.1 IS5 family transposase [Chitinophagales bacterium]MCZ2102663.1 IS5 family transposase [Chitinophagales bacterium]